MVPTGWWVGPGHSTNKLEEDSKMGLVSTSGRMSSQNGCHQHLCPQGELQLPPASIGGSKISRWV